MGLFSRKYSDKHLVAMLVSGEEQANRALDYVYATMYPEITRQIVKNGADLSDAMDAFQNAVIALWKFVKERGQEIVSVKGWLFTAARNYWLNQVKRRKLRDEAADEVRLVYLQAHDQADAEQKRGLLERILLQLDAQCRLILERRFIDGHDRTAIAEDMHFGNLNSVTNKIDKCLKKALLIGREVGFQY